MNLQELFCAETGPQVDDSSGEAAAVLEAFAPAAEFHPALRTMTLSVENARKADEQALVCAWCRNPIHQGGNFPQGSAIGDIVPGPQVYTWYLGV